MNSISDQVTNIVNAEEDKGLIAAEHAKPSSDPAYWAKRSCRTCLGRGLMTVNGKGIVCGCAHRRFKVWRDEWIRNYTDPEKMKNSGKLPKMEDIKETE